VEQPHGRAITGKIIGDSALKNGGDYMWEKLLNTKHFVLLCSSVAVLCLTLSIFIGISAYQSARAQTIPAGCVAVPTTSSGITGWAVEPTNGSGTIYCNSWGTAICTPDVHPTDGYTLSCAAGNSPWLENNITSPDGIGSSIYCISNTTPITSVSVLA